MDCCQLISGRRNFLKGTAMTAAGIAGLGLGAEPGYSDGAEMFIVGPKKGYSARAGWRGFISSILLKSWATGRCRRRGKSSGGRRWSWVMVGERRLWGMNWTTT